MAIRKLMSRQNTLLGTVTFPNSWEPRLETEGTLRFAVRTPADALAQSRVGYDPTPSEEVPHYKTAVLSAKLGFYRDCVELHGITLECFEQLEGCSFAPSMAYLQSIMRDA